MHKRKIEDGWVFGKHYFFVCPHDTVRSHVSSEVKARTMNDREMRQRDKKTLEGDRYGVTPAPKGRLSPEPLRLTRPFRARGATEPEGT